MTILRDKELDEKSPPMVSVVMSVYNGSHFLGDAINSVLAQTYTDLEFIIVDDGSTDDSVTIISGFAERDHRIVFIKKENTGLTRSLNTGLQIAKGEFIARIDSDDIWYPDKLAIQIGFFQREFEYHLLGTAYNEIDTNGSVISENQRLPILASNDIIKKEIVKFNPFFHSSVVFRRSVLSIVGLYNEEFIYAQDYELWIRIISKFKVANLPYILASKRFSKHMISIKKEKKQRIYAMRSKLLAIKLLKKPAHCCRYLINDILVCTLPRFFVQLVRKKIRNRCLYSYPRIETMI